MKHLINVEYDKLLSLIELDNTAFIKLIFNKFKPDTNSIIFERGDNESTLKWTGPETKYGRINHKLLVSKISDGLVSVNFSKDFDKFKIGATVFGIFIGLLRSWDWEGYVFYILAIWILMPLIINQQDKFITKRLVKRLQSKLNLVNI